MLLLRKDALKNELVMIKSVAMYRLNCFDAIAELVALMPEWVAKMLVFVAQMDVAVALAVINFLVV